MSPPRDATGHTRDHGDEILHQIALGIDWKYHFQRTALHLKKRFDVDKSKACQTISMLHHDCSNLGIGQELEQFGAVIIHARGYVLHNLGDLIASTCCIGLEPLHLSLKVCFLSGSGHTGIQSYSLWSVG